MKSLYKILLVLALSTLLVTFTKAEDAAEANTVEDDADLHAPDGADTVEDEWEEVVKQQFSDDTKMHTKDSVLNTAYQHLVYEELDSLDKAREKHESKAGKLTDEEAASLSNALVVKHYIDEKFGDKTEVTNAEALEILNSEKYDTWMDDMPDHVIKSLDDFMPDESDDAEL